MDEKEKREHILSLWTQNISEEEIARIMAMTVKEVHKSIYMHTYRFIVGTNK